MPQRSYTGLVCLVFVGSLQSAVAQQPLPRPIVLYRPTAASGQSTASAPVPSATPSASRTAAAPAAGSTRSASGLSGPRPVPLGTAPLPRTVDTSSGSSGRGPQAVPVGTTPRSAQAQPSSASSSGQVPAPFSQNSRTWQGSPFERQAGPQWWGSPSELTYRPPQADQMEAQTAYDEWRQEQSRPNLQQIQNPSGSQQMTHLGMTDQQQMAPNLYFGTQFQNWTNQQPVAHMPTAQGEMTRFQPGVFGGYEAPNTYFGAGFHNWSNFAPASSQPGANGSWDMVLWR